MKLVDKFTDGSGFNGIWRGMGGLYVHSWWGRALPFVVTTAIPKDPESMKTHNQHEKQPVH